MRGWRFRAALRAWPLGVAPPSAPPSRPLRASYCGPATQAEEAQLRKLEAALEDELRRVKVEETLLQQQLQRVAPDCTQGATR